MSDKSRTILVIEDDQAIRDSLSELLLEEGYGVMLAENGLKALELLKSSEVTPSLILVDISMPVMDGRSFLLELRSGFPRLAHVPVFVATAAGEPVISGLHGHTLVIRKPLDVDHLMDSIDRAVRSSTPTDFKTSR